MSIFMKGTILENFLWKKKKNFFDNFFQFIQQLFQFFIKGFLELIINVCSTRLFLLFLS